jgi:hypothetical protein
MAKVEFLTTGKWRVDGRPLAVLRIRLDDLASRFNAPVQAWHEDGMGPARGFGGRLSSGRLFAIQELENDIKHRNRNGPALYADAIDIAECGVNPLLDEILNALELTRDAVAWVVDADAQESAAIMVGMAQSRRGESTPLDMEAVKEQVRRRRAARLDTTP